jgi:hypothetical protein
VRISIDWRSNCESGGSPCLPKSNWVKVTDASHPILLVHGEQTSYSFAENMKIFQKKWDYQWLSSTNWLTPHKSLSSLIKRSKSLIKPCNLSLNLIISYRTWASFIKPSHLSSLLRISHLS